MEHKQRPYRKNTMEAAIVVGQMTLGTALTALAFGLFIIPPGFSAAGVTGLASVVFGLTPFSLTQVVFAVNMLFLVLGFLFVGRDFTVKTIASSVLFPLFLQVVSRYDLPLSQSPLICVALAGILLGTGTGLLLRSGASSGGFAILGVLLERKWHIPVAVTLNLVDASVILVQSLRQTPAQTVYGILVITLSAFLVGRITSTQKASPPISHPIQGSSLRKAVG